MASSASARFVFLDADSLLDGLRRAEQLAKRVPGASSTRDLRLQMKPFTTVVSGDNVRCRHGVYHKTTPVLAHALGLSGWTMADRSKTQLSVLQKASALLLTKDDDADSNDEEKASDDDSAEETKTLVIVTGDTCEDVTKGRFRETVEAFLDHSDRWCVEIHTWTHTQASVFLQLAQQHPDRVQIQLLDGEDADLDRVVYCAAPSTPNTPLKPKPSAIVTKAASSTGGSPVKKASPANIKSRKHGVVMPALIQARLNRLQSLRQREIPDAYSANGRLRYVVMDADNIFLSVRNATHLHPLVANATEATDLRINFKALTNRVCNSALGFKDDLVRELKAMHYVTPTWLIKGLLPCRWTVEKQRNVMDACLHEELRRLLQEVEEEDEDDDEGSYDSEDGESEEPKKRTLVLVTGDGNEDEVATSASFRGIVDEYLAAGWSVEIHAWTHALHTTYIDLMETRPQDVLVCPLDADYGDEPGDEEASTTNAAMVSTKLVYASPNDNGIDAVSPAIYRPPAMRKPVVITTTASAVELPVVRPPSEAAMSTEETTVDAQARIKQLEAELARVTRDKQALAMQMQLMTTSHDKRVQKLTRERWDAFGACLRAITCPVSGQVLEDPVLLACCRVTMSKAAAQELRDSERGCPHCHVVAFKMMSVPVMDEVVRAVMDHVPN